MGVVESHVQLDVSRVSEFEEGAKIITNTILGFPSYE